MNGSGTHFTGFTSTKVQILTQQRRREALLAMFRGQKGGAASYTRSRGMPGLGDGVCDRYSLYLLYWYKSTNADEAALCDSAWNCSAYAWDLGDCEDGERGGASGHTGTDAATDTATDAASRGTRFAIC
jgi:hypothetical protein